VSSPVVIRCPQCGTTQATLGECEACHEGTVRYYCPNHVPGQWLGVPYCTACGASVGAAPPASAPPPPPRRSEAPSWAPPASSPPADAPRPRRPAPPRRARRDPPERAPERPPDRHAAPEWDPRPDPREPPEIADLPAALRDLLRSAGMRGRMPSRTPRVPDAPAPGIDFSVAASAGRGIASAVGCVVKLVLFLVVAAMIVFGLSIAGFSGVGAPVREWGTDIGQRVGLVEGIPTDTRLAIERYRSGDVDGAERDLRGAAQSYPRSALALVYLARIRMEAGDLERGGELLREAIVREPQSALAHRELGGYHLTRARRWSADAERQPYAGDELQLAERYSARALQLAPDDRQARGYYGCVLAALDRGEEAAVELRKAGEGPWSECAR
jgi:hypothetical protein